MTPQSKKRWVIGTSILVIFGVIGYFVYKAIKPKPTTNDTPIDEKDKGVVSTDTKVVETGSTITNPFKTADELRAFQNWVITDRKDTAILGKYGADGLWGRNSAAAWQKYGSLYNTSSTSTIVSSGLKKGDKVVAKKSTKGFSSQTLAKQYIKGGNGGGWIAKGYYAGIIENIDANRNVALVRNATYPMKSNDGKSVIPLFWLSLSDLEKQ
jgi:hypothetical protein